MADPNDRVSRFMAEFGPRRDVESRRVLAVVRRRMLGRAHKTQISRYEQLERIGHGGMGVVYRALDPLLKRPVAIKVLHPTAGDQRRILNEARALARFSHPNIVGILDTGREGDEVFVVMDYVDGETLADVLSRKPSLTELMPFLEQAVEGLCVAHERSLVHHDIKPSNILISKAGVARIADFGLARLMQDGASPIGGTRGFAAPEQLAERPCDARADIFSMTAIVYAATYGHMPPRVDAEVRVPTAANVSDRLRRFLARGLATDPEQRPPAIRAWWADLRRAKRSRLLPVTTSLAGFGLLCAAALWRPSADVSGPCAQARHFAWTDAAQTKVRNQLDSTRLPFADEVYRGVDAKLTAHGRSWRDVRDRACAARDYAALACLDTQQARTAGLVAWLGTLRVDEVQRVTRALSSLPEPELCADAPDESLSPELERFDEDVARAQALVSAGRYGEGRELLEELELPTDTRRHASRLASYALTLARAFEQAGDYDAAAADFEKAYLLELLAGRDGLAARAASRLAALNASKLGDPLSAQRWLRNAAAAVSRASLMSEEDRGGIAVFRAQTLLSIGDVEGAWEARHLADSLLPPRDRRRADLATVLASIRHRRGDMAGVVEAQQSGLAIMRESLGESHPQVLAGMSNLALGWFELGELDEAEQLFHQVLRHLDGTPEFLPETRTVALFNLANLRSAQGRYEEAVSLYEQTLELQEATVGIDHPKVAMTLTNLGNKLARLGRYEEALAMQYRALQLREAKLGPEHPHLIWTLVGLASCHQGSKEPALAVPHLERALEIGEVSQVDPLLVAGVKFELAQALHATGADRSRVLKLTREAVVVFRDAGRREKDLANIEAFLETLTP